MSPLFGARRLVRSLYVDSETNRTSERSSKPALKLVVRTQITPAVVHRGVEWGQSTITSHTTSTEATLHSFGRSAFFSSRLPTAVWNVGRTLGFRCRQSSVSLPEHAAASTAWRKRLRIAETL